MSLTLPTGFNSSCYAQTSTTIPNHLQHTWPGELVGFDVNAGGLGKDVMAAVQGRIRPAQIDAEGKVWTYVTIDEKDEEGTKLNIDTVPASFQSGKSDAGISVQTVDDFFLIDNGTYQFRLRRYAGKLEKAIPLSELPHWIGGMKSHGQKDWDGHAFFESRAKVSGVTTEVINRGPVFWDFRITYQFENPASNQVVEAMPLALGKQSHRFAPNQLPRESIPKLDYHYELLVRFVMDDPWIDINERFHFPRDPEHKPWFVSQYWIEWGKQGVPVDTVTWVRWFEYDKFGGNTSQQYVPARPRPAQKGRPFALLRPRWNQGGGGAQDFFLTSGGAPPKYDRQTKQTAPAEQANYNPANPAVGIVAAYASKWIGPYVNYIPVYADGGNRGKARFPMVDGERSGMHYGQRAYGLCVGPRHRFTDLNGLVRRHTDWTLQAQVEKYILDWKRDPSKAGPNILITREQLAALQADHKSGKKTPVNDLLRAKADQWKPLIDERDALIKGYANRQEEVAKEIAAIKPRATKRDAPRKLKDELKKLESDARTARDAPRKDARLKVLDKKLKGTDFELYHLITSGKGGSVRLPDSGLWRQRRYQDDFLNPTSSPTRAIPGFATADLFAAGKPIGGASQAAMGYIATDLDAWPGWHQGWSPGNPNFHTDKYMAAIYAGGALLDHPHSREWLEFGLQNFKEDAKKVFTEPDGVGAECPGYSGYAMKLQLGIARILMNTGAGNLIAGNPLVKRNAIWHRKLITPYDRRIKRRHEAPIGDTHRWDSGMYAEGFAKLAPFYKTSDPAFASELMGTWKLLKESNNTPGTKPSDISLKEWVVAIDGSIQPSDPGRLNWESEAFEGFGAVMRDGFGTVGESFVSYKAGFARGHYHNDENSYHFYSGGTPVSLDYNCSYTPRGDHAALHNSMTFGIAKEIKHNGSGDLVPAQEEIHSSAKVLRFVSTPVADLVVSERRSTKLTLRPIDPSHNEFGRHYPERSVPEIVHHRSLVFVKNNDDSPLADYLVVRDVTTSTQRQQLNIHLLARDVAQDGATIRSTGQYDKDMLIFLAEATNPIVQEGQWHYKDEWMLGPTDYTLKPGESQTTWRRRLEALMKQHQVTSLPLPGWTPTWQNPKSETSQQWFSTIEETKGEALMPPPFWTASWMYGEYQKWLRIETKPGTPITWVLYPYKHGSPAPKLARADSRVTVSLGGQNDEIQFAGGQVTLSRDGAATALTE